jgi:hypothetical protein
MILPTHSDFSLEQAALKDTAAKKAAAAAQVAIEVEKYRSDTADALAKAVERECRIETIPALVAQLTTLENRARSSAAVLDTKIVDYDRPLHWVRRNWHVLAGILAANAAVSALLFRLLR